MSKKYKTPGKSIGFMNLLLIFITSGLLSAFVVATLIHAGSSLSGLLLTLMLLFGISLITYTIMKRNRCYRPRNNDEHIAVKPVSQEMNAHYKAAGLNEAEITFFRDTMATAETQITSLCANMAHAPKLTAIDLREGTTKVAKAIFKELVKEPQNLQKAADFLYRHLPNLVDISAKYIEIANHEVQTQDTYFVLDKSISVIEELTAALKKDYAALVSDDITDMENELSFAKEEQTSASTEKTATTMQTPAPTTDQSEGANNNE